MDITLVAGHGLKLEKRGDKYETVLDHGRVETDFGLDEYSVNVQTVRLTAGLCQDIIGLTTWWVGCERRMTLQQKIFLLNNSRRDLAVEFHWNGFHDPDVRGTECLVCGDAEDAHKEASSAYAWMFQHHLIRAMRVRDRGVKERKDLAFLNGVGVPRLITEPDFLTNPRVCRAINDGFLLPQVAYAHASAIYEIVCAHRKSP